MISAIVARLYVHSRSSIHVLKYRKVSVHGTVNMQAARFFTFLHPVYYALYTVGYIVFDHWVFSLILKFETQHEDSNKHYGIGIIVFFILNTLYYAFQALSAWAGFTKYGPKLERLKEHLERGRVKAIGVVLILLVIADIAILCRVANWFLLFQANGDKTDYTYCVAYVVMALLDIWSRFRFAVNTIW